MGIGTLTSSQAGALPDGTLWALISEDSFGNLPGSLLADDSLYSNNNLQTITNSFAGATITLGEIIGGGTVVGVGSTSSGGVINSVVEFTASDYGLSDGDKLGVYWFPGRTTALNTLPTSSFEIGGFHRTNASVASGGDAGLVIPADGSPTNTINYADSNTASGTGIAPTEFQAIAVPEPSTLLLLSLSLLFFGLRRR